MHSVHTIDGLECPGIVGGCFRFGPVADHGSSSFFRKYSDSVPNSTGKVATRLKVSVGGEKGKQEALMSRHFGLLKKKKRKKKKEKKTRTVGQLASFPAMAPRDSRLLPSSGSR